MDETVGLFAGVDTSLFGYAIVRYRLMDVDIIFKRGLAYTFATATLIAVYFAGWADRRIVPHGLAGQASSRGAIVVAAFLFQPVLKWVQGRLDLLLPRPARLPAHPDQFGPSAHKSGSLRPAGFGSGPHLANPARRSPRSFLEDDANPGNFSLSRSARVRPEGKLDLSFLNPTRPAFYHRGCLFFESARAAAGESESVRRTLRRTWVELLHSVPICDRTVAIIGLGKTVDGDFLTSDDLELLSTIAGYVAVAIESSRLYQSLEQKALQIERLKDFSENIVESLKIGVLTVDLEDRIESWNPQLEDLLEIPRADVLGGKLEEVLPRDLAIEIAAHARNEHVSGIYSCI